MKQSMLCENHATPFLDGIAQGVLRYQCCTDCGAPQTLSRYACANCGGSSLQWRDAAGTGTVYATTIVTRAPSDEFRALAPFTLLLVDLDEGSRVMAHGTPGLAIGDRVRAHFLPHAGRHLVVFHPERGQVPLPTHPGEDK